MKYRTFIIKTKREVGIGTRFPGRVIQLKSNSVTVYIICTRKINAHYISRRVKPLGLTTEGHMAHVRSWTARDGHAPASVR